MHPYLFSNLWAPIFYITINNNYIIEVLIKITSIYVFANVHFYSTPTRSVIRILRRRKGSNTVIFSPPIAPTGQWNDNSLPRARQLLGNLRATVISLFLILYCSLYSFPRVISKCPYYVIIIKVFCISIIIYVFFF